MCKKIFIVFVTLSNLKETSNRDVNNTSSAGLSTGCIGLSLGPQDPKGPPKTVVRIESVAGI